MNPRVEMMMQYNYYTQYTIQYTTLILQHATKIALLTWYQHGYTALPQAVEFYLFIFLDVGGLERRTGLCCCWE